MLKHPEGSRSSGMIVEQVGNKVRFQTLLSHTKKTCPSGCNYQLSKSETEQFLSRKEPSNPLLNFGKESTDLFRPLSSLLFSEAIYHKTEKWFVFIHSKPNDITAVDKKFQRLISTRFPMCFGEIFSTYITVQTGLNL